MGWNEPVVPIILFSAGRKGPSWSAETTWDAAKYQRDGNKRVQSQRDDGRGRKRDGSQGFSDATAPGREDGLKWSWSHLLFCKLRTVSFIYLLQTSTKIDLEAWMTSAQEKNVWNHFWIPGLSLFLEVIGLAPFFFPLAGISCPCGQAWGELFPCAQTFLSLKINVNWNKLIKYEEINKLLRALLVPLSSPLFLKKINYGATEQAQFQWCACVCAHCLLCTLSSRTTKEQASHLKSRFRRQTPLFQTRPLLICFSSWFSNPLMATKAFNTSSAAHMKGQSRQKELVNLCTRACARLRVLMAPHQRNGEAEEVCFFFFPNGPDPLFQCWLLPQCVPAVRPSFVHLVSRLHGSCCSCPLLPLLLNEKQTTFCKLFVSVSDCRPRCWNSGISALLQVWRRFAKQTCKFPGSGMCN